MPKGTTLSRRSFLRGTAAALAGGVLAACGATPTPTATPKPAAPAAKATAAPQPTPAPAGPVEIRWGDWPDMQGTKEVIAAFQQANPNVKVTYEPFGDNFDQKLMAQCVAGTAPDVMEIYGSMFDAFSSKGQLLDLRPLRDKYMTAQDLGDFFKWHWPDAFTIPETSFLAGLPWKINVGCLIYNKDAFDEVGLKYPDESWDHDTYAAALKKLTKKSADGKVERYGGYLIPWGWDRFQQHVIAYGGHVVDPKDRTKCLLAEKPAQDALEWLRKLMWDDKVLVFDADVKAMPSYAGSFIEGKIGIIEGMLNVVADRIAPAVAKAPKPIKWGVAHVPKGPVTRCTLGSADGWAIYKNTKNPDWAWKYTYFLTQELYQKLNVIEFQNQLPPRRSLFPLFEAKVKPWQDQGIDSSVFTKALEMGYPRPAESFIKQQESQVVVQDALDRIYRVGGTPVSDMNNVVKKIADIHKP